VRLTFVEAENFLSLRAFRLDLDQRNVVVGPNGAGKSNIFRCIDLMAKAVVVAADSGPTTYPALDDYATAGNRRAPGEPFTVRVGLELTEPSERKLIHLFLRAAVLTNLLAGRNEPVVPTIADTFVEKAVAQSKAQPLHRGAFVVRHDPGQWPWSVGFEFEHLGQAYTYGMLGAVNSGIVSGALPPPTQQSLSGPRLLDRLLPGDDSAGRSPGSGDLTTFELTMLLPMPSEYIGVAVQPVPQGGTPIMNEFEQNFPSPQHNRIFTLASVLDRIVSTSLVMVADRRGLPKLHYSSDDLSRRQLLVDGSEIPAALWTLQGGTPADQRELGRMRSLFTRLTGERFEIQHAPIVSPLQNPSTPPAPEDATLRIEPMVVEGRTAIPVQFAGAGIWEALVLATTAVDRRGKVLLLDEPASHLHPTLQARFWRELATARMQSILITHSTYLVPHSGQDDLESVVRIVRRAGQSEVRRLQGDGELTQAESLPRSRWLQILRSADMRAALFANGVVLVEGPSDLVALSIWWPKSPTARRTGTPSDLNVILLEVEGEAGFDTVIKYLDSFAIPWAIVCDGKAISPTGPNALIRRLSYIDGSDAPLATAKFGRWRAWWEARGVYTLARIGNDEIERFFERHDSKSWEAAMRQERGRSKPRKARAFAELTACPAAADRIYEQIVSRMRT
jgi:energy-coupling factor transporter ATP-binding protein EcfA2